MNSCIYKKKNTMTDYLYHCKDCQKDFSKNYIERNLYYLCPDCGKAEKNMPLKGVLRVYYDYANIKKSYNKDFFKLLTPGLISEYPKLWCLDFNGKNKHRISEELLNRLLLNKSPLQIWNYLDKNILIFDDTRNPTFSYKDRASVLVALKALELGISEISAASTGNAGSSLAGICARAGLTSHVFVPEKIPDAKRIQIQAFGGNLYLVKGDYDLAFDLCLDYSTKKGYFNRNTAYNPLTIEGKKSAAFDIYISTKGKIPEFIFVPVGDGVIISGLYKGFYELKELGLIENFPRLIAVQAKGSDGLARFYKTGKFIYKPAETIADSLSAGAPRNLYMASEAVKETRGDVVTVSDKEIIKAQKEAANKSGVLIEPAAAASLAGYSKYMNNLDHNSKVMLMFTGNGLKDLNSLSSWNKKPQPKTKF